MKLMNIAIFLAASAAPSSFVIGFYAYSHFHSGVPAAIELAGATSALLLGLAFFALIGGVVSKVDALPIQASSKGVWETEK